MNTNQTRTLQPFNILLGVDGSEHCVAAAQLIRDLLLPADSVVSAVAVHAVRHSPRRSLLLAALDEVQAIAQSSGIKVSTGLLHGHPAHEIVAYADKHLPTLIAVGARGLRATLGILLGGVAQEVVEYARWPVLIVRAPYHGLHRILLVTDGSAASQQAAEYVAQFPLPAGVEVRVMHVLPPPPRPELPIFASHFTTHYSSAGLSPTIVADMEAAAEQQAENEEREGQRLLAETLDGLKAAGIEATGNLARGDAATEIIEAARLQAIDLIIAGSRGLDAVKGWLLGSVSRKLVHYAGCSVLIVRGLPESNE